LALKKETVIAIGFCSGTWIYIVWGIFSSLNWSEEEIPGRGSKHHEATMLGVSIS